MAAKRRDRLAKIQTARRQRNHRVLLASLLSGVLMSAPDKNQRVYDEIALIPPNTNESAA